MPPREARPKGDDEQADMEQAEVDVVMDGLFCDMLRFVSCTVP